MSRRTHHCRPEQALHLSVPLLGNAVKWIGLRQDMPMFDREPRRYRARRKLDGTRGAPRENAERRFVSSHFAHLAPALERGPDAALEPEAINRRRGMDR